MTQVTHATHLPEDGHRRRRRPDDRRLSATRQCAHGDGCRHFRAERLDQGQRRRHRAHHADDARDGAGRDDVDADARGRRARLRLDEDQDRVGAAPTRRYGNPNFGGQQLTAGSNSVRGMWKVLRESGAAARSMLVTAAAQTWSVPENTLTTDKGEVIHQASGRRAKYGALVDKAAALPVPKTVTLKDPKAFKVLGQSLPRLDVPEKVNGTAEFGIDVKLPGLLTARVVRCPVFGGKVASFNADKAKAITGVTPRRADQRRHRRRRRELLGGVAGGAGAAGHMGRRSARESVEQRGDRQEAGGARAAAGQGRAQRRQRRGRARSASGRANRTARAHVRTRVRSAVSRARVHGADELHRRREGRQLRRLRADAGADRVAAGGDGRVEAAGRQGEGPRHLHGRRIRPSR